MSSYRVDKIEKLIKEEISNILLYKHQEMELGFITVTNVKVSPDLRVAKIYLSVLDKERRKLVLDRINLKNGQIRSELAHRIRIRFVPELKFFIDDTLDYVEKIEGILNEIHKQNDNKTHK